MLDLSSILTDEDLGGTSFTVIRRSYVLSEGTPVPQPEQSITVSGNIQPASPEDLQLFPEEERSSEWILVLSPICLQTGEASSSSSYFSADIILHRGKKYRVARVRDWLPQGGFHKAWAIRQREES